MGVQRMTRWVADVAITLLSLVFVSDAAGLQGIECIDGLKDNFIIQTDAGRSAAVKIILQLTWVTFAVGTQWSALGVGVRLGEGREGRGRPSATRRGSGRRDGHRTELNE